jgi:2-aminoadipate transaminase
MSDVSLTHLYSKIASGAQPSAIREICKLIDRPNMKSLAGGWPDPAVFPGKEISSIAAEQLTQRADQVLQYGTTEGLAALRQELVQMARKQHAIDCKPEQILITHGSAQAMDLACRVLIDPGDMVMVGLPTYFGGTGAIKACGGEVTGVPVDNKGMNTDRLADILQQIADSGKRIKGIYVIPNFQNPTGVTLSLKRRKILLTLAESYDLVIFEDDPYGELRYEGRHLPSLMSLDTSGRVIHMRSMSKIFAPGMRIGWVIGQPEVIRKMVIAKQFVDCATNTLAQYVLLEFIRSRLLAKTINHNIKHYRRKRDYMLQQLKKHFPRKVKWNRPAGGFFIFVRLPEYLNATELLTEAVDSNVAFVAGAPFYIDGSGQNTFRLSYSQASKADIAAGVKALGAMIKQRLKA